VGDVSAAKRVADLEAVVDTLGAEKVAIFAWALSGPPALIYAAAHPERVSHLILYGTLASGAIPNPALGRALIDLIRADWIVGSRTMIQVVTRGTDSRMIDDGAKFLQMAASGEVAAAILEEGYFKIDVRDRVPQVKVPSLVLHRRDDPAVPFTAGRELAALLPDAHFLPLPGDASNPTSSPPRTAGRRDPLRRPAPGSSPSDSPTWSGRRRSRSASVTPRPRSSCARTTPSSASGSASTAARS